MDVRQCRDCRKLFQYRGNPLCPACVDRIDKLFEDVRNYIYDNPHAAAEEICEETGAEMPVLYTWLREGRLILSKDGAKLIQCESCGSPISIGRYCDSCAVQVRSQLEGAAKSFEPKAPEPRQKKDSPSGYGPRMHVDFKKK